MPEERYEERTLPATPRKREEARERGFVARSMDLNSAVVLLAGVVALNLLGSEFSKGLTWLYKYFFENLHQIDIHRDTLQYYFLTLSNVFLMTFIPILLVIFVAALFVNIFQVGFLFTLRPLEPNLERLNPINGLWRIFSLRSLVMLGLNILKVIFLGIVVFKTLWDERFRMMILHEKELQEVISYIINVIFTISIRAALVLLILALIDYGYNRYQYERDLMMSRTEYLEELKRYEGDPRIRQRRLTLHRQLVVQRMLGEVPRATVVITNPTEIAVALQYKYEIIEKLEYTSKGPVTRYEISSEMKAPKCIAKGIGHIAREIIRIARKYDVPVVQNPPLAQALYKMVEIGQYIPLKLWHAVADVLRYVIDLKRWQKVGA